MTERWPVVIDDQEYSPIPESWIEHGHDDGDGQHRVYAVSAASGVRDILHVRYIHPSTPKVLRALMQSAENPTGDGVVPSMLATYQTWPRSIIADGVEPVDVARKLELEHLRELWGERVESIPSSAEDVQLLADGGRAVESLLDHRQTHLTEFKREGL